MNIAVFYGNKDIFTRPLIEHWLQKGHTVRWSPNYSIWDNFIPDIMFFDMVTSNLVGYTNRFPETAAKVVTRMHGVGCRLNIYKAVKWEKVHDIIYVSDWLKEQCPIQKVNMHVVYNGVDLNKFYLKKSFERTYKIAYIGYLGHLKGIDKLESILKKFKKINERYTLHKALGDVKDINAWLEDKDYLIQPSNYETFCYAVAEAMAKGIRPLIAKWPGAERTWGNEFWLDDFNLTQEPERFRKIIEDKYNQIRMLNEIDTICGIQ